MAETKPPLGLDPNLGTRGFVIEVDAEALEKMRRDRLWKEIDWLRSFKPSSRCVRSTRERRWSCSVTLPPGPNISPPLLRLPKSWRQRSFRVVEDMQAR